MTDQERKIYGEIISRYVANNPLEWEGFLKYAAESRASLSDPKFGQLKEEKAMRFGGTMPAALYNQIRLAAFRFFGKDIDEKFFDQEFLNDFPAFRVAQKL